MGLCFGSPDAKQDKFIEDENAEAWAVEQEKVRLLLLGAGESGKSTIFKQIQLLHGAGFSDMEREQFRPYIFQNTISSMKSICEALCAFGMLDECVLRDKVLLMGDISASSDLDPQLAALINELWHDQTVQRAWDRRSEYQVIHTAPYYFQQLGVLSSPGYTPTDEDIIRARVRTTGIKEEHYIINTVHFSVIDVGGQRNERKKWIHLFDRVNAMIFVAALSEYDQMCFEDDTQNRMVEAITLFGEVVNNEYLSKLDVILFLNKRDLFADKVQSVLISSQEPFMDYNGEPYSYEDGVAYFLNKFVAETGQQNKKIFHHETCATDTENVRVVFNACREIVLRGNFDMLGMNTKAAGEEGDPSAEQPYY